MTHVCTPKGYPSTAADTWTCPICQSPFVAKPLSEHSSEMLHDAVARGLMDGEAVGWVNEDGSAFAAAFFPWIAA